MRILSKLFGSDKPTVIESTAPVAGAELKLPAWAKAVPSTSVAKGAAAITIAADTDGYVREWFGILKVQDADQYWLEVAYQCAKMDLQMAIENTPFDPRISGKPAEFKFSRAPQWALSIHPVGRGIAAASQGREAREHFRRVRGRLPF